MGRLKGEDAMTEQAYRYSVDEWDVDAARSHCEAHDGTEFAPAEEPMKEMSPRWLRAGVKAPVVGVDRANRVVRGMVLAQEGVFKDRRGQFDQKSLAEIVRLANAAPQGLKSRFGHATVSDDAPGKFLGRARDARLDRVRVSRDGKVVTLQAARADLHLDPTASSTPHGDLAGYVLSLAESDPDALSASLVLEPEEIHQIDSRGGPAVGPDGLEVPPLWQPRRLHSIDVVDEGAAVDGILSADTVAQALSLGALTPELEHLLSFDRVARLGAALLDGLFRGKGRAEVEARCRAWLGRYLSLRFPPEPPPPGTPRLDAARLRLDELALATRRLARSRL
jgi:hypothetical protein